MFSGSGCFKQDVGQRRSPGSGGGDYCNWVANYHKRMEEEQSFPPGAENVRYLNTCAGYSVMSFKCS